MLVAPANDTFAVFGGEGELLSETGDGDGAPGWVLDVLMVGPSVELDVLLWALAYEFGDLYVAP